MGNATSRDRKLSEDAREWLKTYRMLDTTELEESLDLETTREYEQYQNWKDKVVATMWFFYDGMFTYADVSKLEVHASLKQTYASTAVVSSLLAGTSVTGLQVVNTPLDENRAFGSREAMTVLFVIFQSLAFVFALGSVVSSSFLTILVASTPSNRIYLFIRQMRYVVNLPTVMLLLTLVFVAIEYTLLSFYRFQRDASLAAGIIVGGGLGLILLGLVLIIGGNFLLVKSVVKKKHAEELERESSEEHAEDGETGDAKCAEPNCTRESPVGGGKSQEEGEGDPEKSEQRADESEEEEETLEEAIRREEILEEEERASQLEKSGKLSDSQKKGKGEDKT
mmetsp:Transcript_5477/g.33822  ORF Transcript_5477/g.33822 Transcript_5477/m.33822 type:complete len:338 (-) Transcript_5477:1619-2632(-)